MATNFNNLSGLLGLLQQQRGTNVSNALNQQYQWMMQQANAANDYRYQQGLGELAGLRGRSMGYIDQMGAQQSADINRDFKDRQAQVDMDLMRRGMLGSTNIVPATTSVGEGRAAAQNRLAEQLAQLRLGADQSTTNQLTGFIERRNDQAPELSQLAQLQQGLGNAGAGGFPFGGTGGFTSATAPGAGMSQLGSRAPVGAPVTAPGRFTSSTAPGAGSPQAIGHFGPGSGGAGGAAPYDPYASYRPGATRPANIGHFGPGSGGAGYGGVYGTGYPTLNNGVVQDPWVTPIPGMIGAGNQQQYPAGGTMQNTNSVNGQLNELLLNQLRQANREAKARPGGGSRAARPFIAATPDLQNGNRDMNGRLVTTPRNPGFFGSATATANSRAPTITMPGSFQGFRGSAPTMPRINMGVRGYNYTPRARKNPYTMQTTPSMGGGNNGWWQSSSGQWHPPTPN